MANILKNIVTKLAQDNKQYFSAIREPDYEFLIKAKYGNDVNAEILFNKRVKNTIMVMLGLFFVFLSNKTYINIIIIFLKL